jgi:Bacterial archaeo-eukaryotic release factor family 3
MTLLTKEDLMTLAERRPGWHVSFFLPMHRAGVDTLQNPVRCKNLLRQAEEHLLAHGLQPASAQELLAPVQRLLADYNFWQHQSEGLALFVAPEVFRHYRLPLAFEELVVVTQRFHLKPLLPLFSDDGPFYVLALSQKQVRLLACTRYSVTDVDLPNVPQSRDAALQAEGVERQPQTHNRPHAFTSATAGERAATFRGHGMGVDDEKDRLVDYFRQVDHGLSEMVAHTPAPVVLAGVEYLLPLYREVATSTPVVATGVRGNPEGLRAAELQERAWSVVEPRFRKDREDAADRYRRYAGTGLASSDLQEVVLAAYHGRVSTLFVACNTQQWGTFDPQTQAIQVVQEAALAQEDLLDCAALHTFLNSGTVYAVPTDHVPAAAPLAAVLRY